MAPMIFTKAIFEKKSINIFNFGKMNRDFTYIDDVVEGIYRCCKKPATEDIFFDKDNPSPSSSFAPFRIFNLGNSQPINIMNFIEELEKNIGIEAKKNFVNMQQGDVETTFADCSKIHEWIEFKPKTSLNKGIKLFVNWYKNYYCIK